jgi:hypothetical protein
MKVSATARLPGLPNRKASTDARDGHRRSPCQVPASLPPSACVPEGGRAAGPSPSGAPGSGRARPLGASRLAIGKEISRHPPPRYEAAFFTGTRGLDRKVRGGFRHSSEKFKAGREAGPRFLRAIHRSPGRANPPGAWRPHSAHRQTFPPFALPHVTPTSLPVSPPWWTGGA